MSNFQTARDALSASIGSEGSALKEHGRAMDSIELKLNALKASWQSFAQTFMDSKTLKVGIDLLSGVVNVLEKLIDTLGVLGTVGTGIVTKNLVGTFISSIKGGKGNASTITTDTNTAATDVNTNSVNENTTAVNANTTAKQANTTAKQANITAENADATTTDRDTASTNLNTTAEKTNTAATTIDTTVEKAHTVATNADIIATKKDTIETNLNTAAEKTNTTATNNSSGAIGKLTKNTGKGVSAFSKFTSAIGGWIGIASIAITVISSVYNAIKKAKEEAATARQEVIETSDAFLEASSSFEQAYIKYSGKTNLTVEEEAELTSAINGTVNALGDKSSALQTVVNNSNDYVASLEAIKNAELDAAKTAAENKMDKGAEALKEAALGWESFDGSEVDITFGAGFKKIENSTTPGASAAKIAKEMGSKFYVETPHIINGEKADIVLPSDADVNEIIEYYNFLIEFRDALKEAGYEETNYYGQVEVAIEKMSESISVYTDAVYEAAKANYQLREGIPKTTEEYVAMREAILTDGKLDNYSIDQKKAILNSLDSEYGQVFDLSSAEVQARKFIGLIKGFGNGTIDGTNDIGTVETFLNMRTAVNNGECSVGEYMSAFKDVTSLGEEYSDEENEYFTTSLGLDTDKIKQQYDDMYKYLSRQNIDWFEGYEFTPEFRLEKDNIKDQEIREFIDGLTATELQAAIDIRTEIDWKNASDEDIRKQIEERAKLNEALRFEASIEVDKTALELLNTALEESASAMGLTEESIDSLKSKYSELKGYNPHTLFEKTANGVKLNRDEVAKLEKEYNDLKKTEVQEHLDTLVDEYNKCTKAIDGNIGSQEKLELISKREKYAEQIEELAEYQSQLEGVTGAYQRWIDAQNAPEDYEGYQAVATGREDIKDEIKRGFISNSTKEYIDLLSGEDLVGGTIDDYAEAWDRLDKKVGSTSYSIHDFFTVNDDGDITSTGIDRFFAGIRKDFDGEVYKLNKETGEYYYDFSQENLKAIQDEWGIGIEAIELLLEAAASAGYDIDWGGIFDDLDIDISNFESVEAMISLAEKAQEEFNKIKNLDDVEFNFRTNNIQDATAEVEKARKAYVDLITNDDGSINLKAEGAEQMQFMLATLLTQKQQLSTPAIMKVDTSQIDKAETDIIDVINKAKELQTAYENYEIAITTGVDVEGAKKDLNSAIDGMKGTSVDVRADLKLPTDEELQTAKDSIGDIKVGATLDGTAIGNLATKIQTECTPEVIAKVTGLDESAVASEPHQVVYTAEHKDVDNFINSLTDISKKIIYSYTTEGNKPDPSNINRKITYTYETEGDVPEAYGTANANGTASGRAFARGNWGIKGSGTALGGELGQELIVRDGKFFTIGDHGAEFFHYKPNDIVFNAAQTESLFKYGGIKGAKPRGKMLASGSAFSDGNAFPWNATGTKSNFANERNNFSVKKDKKKAKTETKTTTKDDSVTTTTTTSWSANASESDFAKNRNNNNSNSSKSKSSSSTKEDFKETFDWIEIALSRIEREIDQLDKKANNVYKSWSSRNSALTNEISKVGDEIELQQKAAQRYLKEANSVGLSSSWASKVRNGEIDISTIKDEKLAEKIKDYQKWYELYLQCTDAAEELREQESKLYAQRFENIQTQYDAILQGYEHTETMLNEYISQAEAKGYIVSKKYYDALITNEKQNISELKKEQADLIAERDTAVDAGKIVEGSQAWLEQCAAIDEVTQSIEEANTALIEYSNSIREIDWQIFDIIQERISDVAAETEFLVELMSNEKLFDDNGKLTGQGVATMGLHALSHNTAMYQADLAGEEAEKLRKQLESDPYDTTLEERYREMIALQREYILAAEDSKNAMSDMVENGIELELQALDERIQKYEEALDSQKD